MHVPDGFLNAPTSAVTAVIAAGGVAVALRGARRELDERRDVEFPPTVHMAAIDGTVTALHHFIDQLDLPETAEILGPVDLPPGEKLPGSTAMKDYNEPVQRILVRAPLGPRNQLGMVLKAAYTAVRTLHKNDTPVRIQVDPIHIG